MERPLFRQVVGPAIPSVGVNSDERGKARGRSSVLFKNATQSEGFERAACRQ